MTFKTVPSRFLSPYQSVGGGFAAVGVDQIATTGDTEVVAGALRNASPDPSATGYHGDLIAEAHQYARLCVELARGETFDVVHAHDWLTFPAGMAVATVTINDAVAFRLSGG